MDRLPARSKLAGRVALGPLRWKAILQKRFVCPKDATVLSHVFTLDVEQLITRIRLKGNHAQLSSALTKLATQPRGHQWQARLACIVTFLRSRGHGGRICKSKNPNRGVVLKIKQEGQTAGFGPCFHLPGFHFGPGFLSHSHNRFLAQGKKGQDLAETPLLPFQLLRDTLGVLRARQSKLPIFPHLCSGSSKADS